MNTWSFHWPNFCRHKPTQVICLIFLLAVSGSANCQKLNRVYFVGNSITDAIHYDGLQDLATAAGFTQLWARHIIPGAPMRWLWTHPNEGYAIEPYGSPPTAFTLYSWDAISLEPFDRELEHDLVTIDNYIHLARPHSPAVKIYLYARWPRNPYNNDAKDPRLTAALWNYLYDMKYPAQTRLGRGNEARAYFVRLTNIARMQHPFTPIYMVPVTQVFHALNLKMMAKQIPGFSSIWDFYHDGNHPKGIGRYVTALTFFATLYRTNPQGLPVPEAYGKIPPWIVPLLQKTVWEVVSSHRLSGVAPSLPTMPQLPVQ
jgi:hypothetical protein